MLKPLIRKTRSAGLLVSTRLSGSKARSPGVAASMSAVILIAGLAGAREASAEEPAVIAAAAAAQSSLDSLVEQFAGLEQISFNADVAATFQAPDEGIPPGTVINGSFDYQADGVMWRKASHLDSELYPGMNTEIAYDGSWYQYHMRESDVLSVSLGHDERMMGMTLLNPIFLFAQFLVPVDDTGSDVLLDHVRTAAQEWTDPGIDWSEAGSPEAPAMRGVLPGDVAEGRPYDIDIVLPIDDPAAPIVMEMVAQDGAVMMRSTFAGFVFLDNAGVQERWPTHAVFEVLGETGESMLEMSMDIRNLRVGGPPAEDAGYSLDVDDISTVWFDEGQTFLK